MEQEFTATVSECGEMEFSILGVFLSDMDQERPAHHFLGFQRTLPDADDDGEEADDDGFYIEYNGQENGCYQKAGETVKVKSITLRPTMLEVSFSPAANFHAGVVDATGDVPLDKLTVHLDLDAEQVAVLREALRTAVAEDCPFTVLGTD